MRSSHSATPPCSRSLSSSYSSSARLRLQSCSAATSWPGVMPLYFSRAISRFDYATARLLGLLCALLVLVLAPQIILFVGRVLIAPDLLAGLEAELPAVPATVAISLVGALLVGSVSAAIAAMSPRRSYATMAIVAVFLITTAPGRPPHPGTRWAECSGQIAILLSPGDVLDGLNAFLFGVPAESDAIQEAGIEGWVYAVAATAWILGSLSVPVPSLSAA